MTSTDDDVLKRDLIAANAALDSYEVSIGAVLSMLAKLRGEQFTGDYVALMFEGVRALANEKHRKESARWDAMYARVSSQVPTAPIKEGG